MERMLVGVDGSGSAAHAEAWAADLARQLGARVMVCTVWQPSRADLPEAEARAERAEVARRLEGSWCDAVRAAGVPFESAVLDSDGPDALLTAADRFDAALLVVGTRGVGGFAGLRLGSVSDYLAHRTTRPLAVVPTSAEPGVRRILLGLDDTDRNLWAVGFCGLLAQPLEAQVIAAHVRRPPPAWSSERPEDWRAAAQAELEAWVAPLRDLGVALDTQVVESHHPAGALLDLAKDVAADTIVVGTRDLSGYRLLRLGGVTMRLLHHSDRPVIVVPPLD